MYRFNDSTIDDRIKEIVYSGDALYSCHLTIDGNTVPSEQISKITISKPIIDTSTEYFYVGTFISDKLTIKFKNLDGLNIQSGNAVELDIGIDDGGIERIVPIGLFQIDELEENYFETCEITCLDNAVKFKPPIDYSPCFTEEEIIDPQTGETTTVNKASVATILQYICTYFETELDENYPTVNDDVEVGTYDSSVSGKQWISYIAEIKGCNAKIGRDGKLYLLPINPFVSASIDAEKGASWKLGEKYEISQVTYFDAIRNFTFPQGGDDSGNTLFIRQENPFIVDETVVSNIFDEVDGTVIWNLSNKNYGDITLDSGDAIEYTIGQDTYKTLYNGNITYEITIMDEYEVKIPSKQQEITTNVLKSDVVNRKKIEALVDQINGQVIIDASDRKGVQDDLEKSYSTTSQIETMIINAENGITNTFSEAGGNNILRNTRFFAQEVLEAGQVYEYWYGNVERINNNNSANGYSILLKNGTLSQTQQVANGNYTLSFYYKKTNALANCSVVINGASYPLEQNRFTLFQTGLSKYYQTSDTTYQANTDYYVLTDNEYVLLIVGTDYEVGDTITGTVYNLDYINPIQISANQITVEFVSDTDDACEIYDIMLNAGAVKLAYSQNQNETVTNTVNISKGITITASDQNVKFVATPDGIRIKNKNSDATVTYFTDEGMETDNAVIKDSAKIVGIYRQKVGNQIWDSMN